MDYPNNNTKIIYDHRNLITEFTRQDLTQELPITDVTKYKYDEAGNRTRKTVFLSEEYDPPPFPEEEADLPPGWTIIVDDYYSRDVAGREIMVYSSYTLQYWNVWSGNEIVGRINYDGNIRYYYLNDHLGSVRAVLDEGKTVISANDYDMWGYYLEGRTYEPYTTKNKFTGKERDSESSYDYFGARYYDSRVGRWGATDPLFEKHIQFTPYNYVLGNPLILIDPDGKQIEFIYKFSNIFTNIYSQYLKQNIENSYSFIQREQFHRTEEIKKIELFGYESGIIESAELQPADFIAGAIVFPRFVSTSIIGESILSTEAKNYLAINTEQTFPKLYYQLEKQLERDGAKSIIKSLKSTENELASHFIKLNQSKFNSSIKREINTFQKQINTIKKLLKNKGFDL